MKKIIIPTIATAALALGLGTVSVNSASAGTHHSVQQRMPAGFHYRTVWYQIDDCGKHNAGKKKIIMWKGNGDMQSALFCPDGSVQPS